MRGALCTLYYYALRNYELLLCISTCRVLHVHVHVHVHVIFLGHFTLRSAPLPSAARSALCARRSALGALRALGARRSALGARRSALTRSRSRSSE
jgi:hypothetical protein